MDKDLREKIALFRYGLISTLVNQKGASRGEQELRIRQITSQSWMEESDGRAFSSPNR